MADISVPIGDELEAIVNAEVVGVTVDLWNGLVIRTPFGDPSLWQSKPPADYVAGKARSNWFVSSGAPIRTRTEETKPSSSSASLTRAISEAKRQKYPTLTISNNMPYIRRLNDGHSTQAPKKFVENEITRAVNAELN